MSDTIRIRLSAGLVIVAIIHAICFGAITYVIHPKSPEPAVEVPFQVPSRPSRPYGDTVQSPIRPLESLPDVNLSAQSEMKQGGPCLPCLQPQSQSRPYASPIYINGERVVAIGPTRWITPSGTPAVMPASNPVAPITPILTNVFDSSTSKPGLNVVNVSGKAASKPTTPKKEYQVALFLDQTDQSKQLLSWFQNDPKLLKLRAISEFQVFKASDALYKARYASIVPENQFPVILFQDATGGHIHAAGRSMIPGTAAGLWSDIKEGQKLWKQAKSGNIQMTGALKTEGYSWDDQILPSMQLSAEDCPDGYCPTPDTTWKPGDFFRPDASGGLFDRDNVPRNMLLWTNVGEIATVALFALAGVMLVVILIRRSGV